MADPDSDPILEPWSPTVSNYFTFLSSTLLASYYCLVNICKCCLGYVKLLLNKTFKRSSPGLKSKCLLLAQLSLQSDPNYFHGLLSKLRTSFILLCVIHVHSIYWFSCWDNVETPLIFQCSAQNPAPSENLTKLTERHSLLTALVFSIC